jgi:gliding motility-associated-like protein
MLLNRIKYATLNIFLLILGMIFYSEMRATHIVGGEITYAYLGNDLYEITLKVYRDCGPTNTLGTGFDDEVRIGVFLPNGSSFDSEYRLYLIDAEVDYVPVVLDNPCFILPPNLCVERAIYTGLIELPFNAGGYDLVYQRCCRNPSIVNLDFPEQQGASFWTHVTGSSEVDEQNTSAVFNNYPPVALCMFAEFEFDHSATDADGDSLVYELCSPVLGGSTDAPAPIPSPPPYTGLNYSAGFSANYPIASNPAFTIDPVTGLISGTPNELGQYVIGICVSEYRDGVLINSSNRDFQFNVTACDPVITSSIPEQDDFCSGSTITFQNDSENAEDYFWDFGVPDIDSDTSNLEFPTYTYTEPGTYTVTLIVNPTWTCSDESSVQFTVMPAIVPEITVTNYECINHNDYYDFVATSNATNIATYEWNFGADSNPQFASGTNPLMIMMNPEAAQMVATVTVTDNGCVGTDQEVLNNPPDPVAGIAPQDAFCEGFTYDFQHNAQNAQSYLWNFGLPGAGDISLQPNPSFTFPNTGNYNIMLVVSADFACSDTTYTNVEIFEPLDPFFPDHEVQCIDENSFDFLGQGAGTLNAAYSWDFGDAANLPTTNQQNPQNITYNETGFHVITLTISENDCVKTYTDSVQVVDHFIANLSLDDANGCVPLITNLAASAESDVPVYYLWDFGDGQNSQQGLTTHTYESAGTYDVTVSVFTLQGCVDTLTQVFNNAVIVHPNPTPGFTITPQIVDILYPETVIADSSFGSVNCFYTMSDGGMMEGCDFTYLWNEAGIQTITQHVENEFGCTARVTGTVIINGFVFHAPNAFTPDFDGLNDGWLPEMTGITEYDIKIFNRWGEMIFQSSDPKKPWFGEVTNGEYVSQNNVYQYIVKAKDLIGQPHEFKGHITIVR